MHGVLESYDFYFGINRISSDDIVFISNEKICFLIHDINLEQGASIEEGIYFEIRAYPEIENNSTLREAELVTINFDNLAESLLKKQTNEGLLMLKPGQGKELIHK